MQGWRDLFGASFLSKLVILREVVHYLVWCSRWETIYIIYNFCPSELYITDWFMLYNQFQCYIVCYINTSYGCSRWVRAAGESLAQERNISCTILTGVICPSDLRNFLLTGLVNPYANHIYCLSWPLILHYTKGVFSSPSYGIRVLHLTTHIFHSK